jgi:hypothetical protein
MDFGETSKNMKNKIDYIWIATDTLSEGQNCRMRYGINSIFIGIGNYCPTHGRIDRWAR